MSDLDPTNLDYDPTKLPKGCAVCGKTENLLRCSGCKVLHYCGRDHQTEHRPKHKSACTGVKRAREALDKAKEDLINHPDFKNDNPFDNHVGRFWKITETRPYMMALSKLVHSFQNIRHADAVQAELDLCMEMLRLCPGDNMGVRGSVPGVMLRLNKDQECYDFIKWWETASDDPRVDVNDIDVTDKSRYLNIKNADIFEPVDFVSKGPTSDLSHPLCLMILKFKLLIDLLKLNDMKEKVQKVMAKELKRLPSPVEMARTFLVERHPTEIKSSIILTRDDLLDERVLSATIVNVKNQIDKLYEMIDARNSHVWPGIKDSEETLSKPVGRWHQYGNWDEMRIALHQTWDTWIEHAGALEFITWKIDGKADDLRHLQAVAVTMN